jgi:23S rRNA pseudouridine2605 synthase
MRLNRYIAQAGLASRREADELIANGRVRVNGQITRGLGTSVEEGDRVEVRGAAAKAPAAYLYLVLHKPTGVVTTLRDPQGRRTVRDLLPPGPRVVPVGRLDYDTSGVLLLTNDGQLTHKLLHPRFGVEKVYRATIAGRLDERAVRKLRQGIELGEFRTAPAAVRVVALRRDRSVVDVTLHEGRNRQVRRMFEALGHPVGALTRLRFGPIALGGLRAGAIRKATRRERAALEHLRRRETPSGRGQEGG